MKKFIYILLATIMASCVTSLEDDEVVESSSSSEVRVLTRAATDIAYPLTLYAFDSEEGTLTNSVKVESSEENIVMGLGSGSYHLVAVGGTTDCSIPKSPELESVISLPATNSISQPLQMGSVDVTVTKDATVSITLYNQVAAVDLSLSDIPSGVEAVSVTLSMLNTGVAFDGSLSGSGTTTVQLTKNGEVWKAPRFYTLPGNGGKLTLSITATSDNGEQTYGYTHSSTLEGNTPYTLVGSYESGFSVNGSVALAGWNAPKEINFIFGSRSESEDEGVEEDLNLETITVDKIPQAGKIWYNHFVAATQDVTDTSAELVLLSTTEWTGVTSANHEETPDMAVSIVEEYTEEGLSDWSIPTRDEAKLMRSTIGLENLSSTNAVLEANKVPTLAFGEEEGSKNTVRYLCDDANFSFVWDGTSVSKGGTKRTYHLRAIKRVKVVMK